MSSEFSIKVEGLGKCYQIYETPRDRLKQFIMPRVRRFVGRPPKKYYREFWALKDVSFEVRKGETVGIIGQNGSGKSTLLQMICGTLAPTAGSVETNGRVAALLELGSGFNPEFSGRENVYLNGAVLGLTKDEIDARFDDIAAFADIGDFITQPVKNYSSGMVVRLAFAVQAQSDPDILIVDEALAVGDAKFQAKCFSHLKSLKLRGTSILFVSHATEQIATHCDRAVFLKNGNAIEIGKPRDVINTYLDSIFGVERLSQEQTSSQDDVREQRDEDLSVLHDVFSSRRTYNAHEYRWGDGAATLLDYDLTTVGASDSTAVKQGSEVRLRLSIRFQAQVIRPILGFTIKTKEGVTLYNTNSEMQGVGRAADAGMPGGTLKMGVSFKALFSPGEYFISLGVASRRPDGTVVPHDRRYDCIQMTVTSDGKDSFTGFFDIGAEMFLESSGSGLIKSARPSDAIV